jgi:hypothetical protein
VVVLSYRSWTLWLLGYPDAALADADRALKEAREIGQAATLMYALAHATRTYFWPETTPHQTRSLKKSSLWRTKKAPRHGKRWE